MPERTPEPSRSSPHRLLVISAHPDDETFGAGGAIALDASRGSEVTVCCLTGTAERHAELRAACSVLGAKVVADERPDFSLKGREVADRLIPLLGEERPEIIITHSMVDYHPDHRAVHKAVLRAAEWAGHVATHRNKAWRPHRILCMEVNNLLSAPTLFVDISETIDLKRRAVLAYRTPLAKTEGYYLSFNMQKAQLRGLQANCQFAEAFVEVLLPVQGPFYAPSPTVRSLF
jgi:LmbE family N-acetylglucosaminyl deacetylase